MIRTQIKKLVARADCCVAFDTLRLASKSGVISFTEFNGSGLPLLLKVADA